MDVKKYDVDLAIKLSKAMHDMWVDSPHDIGIYLAQIVHEHTRPDPAEVERLVDEIIRLSKLCEKALWSRTIEKSVEYELALDKARADLLKLVGGE